MTYLENIVNGLEMKISGRLRRAKILARDSSVSPIEADEMIRRQREKIKKMSVDQIIDEFIDKEELLLREILDGLSE